MTFEKITDNNIAHAVLIQAELFPGESARANFEDSLNAESGYEYYLIRENGKCAGITGFYTCAGDPDSAWLGWFGIRVGFRRKGLGTKALRAFEETAAARGFRFARLYTDAEDNDAAIAFYEANGYSGETYLNPEDPACLTHRTLIFSKPLGSEPLVPWNSRNIHLTQQIARQDKYNEDPAAATHE